ncbi:MAG TPA: signal peptidase II [Burkholderiales bacterium]|nr:signal peptidase II [Burkholderiales bacterium]
MPKAAPWFLVAALVLAADRLTKWLILGWLRPGESYEVTGFLELVLVFNRGAAFSFLADAPGWQRPFFIAVAVVVSAIVCWMLWRHPGRRLLGAGLALILGGALGNLWDRVAIGAVVDFLDFHAYGWHWPAFNVADSAISAGAALVIADGFRHRG